MDSSVLILLLNVFILTIICDASNEAHYECGSHGRFEYCIDGIPGCVIGCHCHPGYYFDTETKICEPNIKLTHDYRRHYSLEPTRMPIVRSSEIISLPTPSTINPLDEKVDAIAEDADDLGDWLYNQFFKTIENQVINKTESEPLTRRSGSLSTQAAKPMPKRRSRRKQKKRSKRRKGRQKINKKGLKKKLLRITEDDSLFDSSSDDSDDTSSSSDYSSDSSTDMSLEEESHRDNAEHGHRKIVMINKKPTPSLPSFIFLPNVETPFYPPIGLPPPPVIPMFPMVPVPPVPGLVPNLDPKDPTTNGWSITTTPTTITKASSATTITDATTETTTSSTSENPNVARFRTKESEENSKNLRQNIQRNKIMQLRNKMKKLNRNSLISPLTGNYPNKPFNDPDLPNQLEDVDFKYLSELIHKIDLNKTNLFTNEKHGRIDNQFNFNPALTRRNQQLENLPQSYYGQYGQPQQKMGRPASKADDLNETFYSNLGKQIATLIREKVDEGQSQFDIEVEKNKNKSPMHAIFNENRFAPRSYWERFVRSPLLSGNTIDTNNEDLKGFKLSTENLFSLEDRANVAAAFEKVLSLRELENIANTMVGKPNQKPKEVLKSIRRAPMVNINLLPPVSRIDSEMLANKKKNMHQQNDFNIYPRKLSMYGNRNSINAAKNITKSELSQSPLKTSVYQQIPRMIERNMSIPPANVARHIVKYQLNPMLLKSVSYIGNNRNQYQTQQAIMPYPISQHAAIKPITTNPQPSYFHHEFHHFDYFD